MNREKINKDRSVEKISDADDMERNLIFDNFKNIARTIVCTFGRNCEVAIHDFRNLDHSLIHIEGNITGRQPGAPITNLVLNAWRKEGDEVGDIVNYPTRARNGHKLKSSTSFIRNSEGKLIGAFCINFDLTDYEMLTATIVNLTMVESPDGRGVSETFASYMEETSDALIESAVDKVGKHPSTMTREEKLNFIKVLENEGAFLIKGMVHHVSRVMDVSIFTVYNYMRQVKKELL